MSEKIDSRYPINEETSLRMLQKRWRMKAKEVLEILIESGIDPFLRAAWVSTPYENIKDEDQVEKSFGKGGEITYRVTTLVDNAAFTDIAKKQYVSCRVCDPIGLGLFRKCIDQGKTRLWLDCTQTTRRRGGVSYTGAALIGPYDGIFYSNVISEDSSIFFDGSDLKQFEQEHFKQYEQLHLNESHKLKSDGNKGKQLNKQQKREHAFKYWLAGKQFQPHQSNPKRVHVKSMTREQVWNELRLIESDLFNANQKEFFDRQQLAIFMDHV